MGIRNFLSFFTILVLLCSSARAQEEQVVDRNGLEFWVGLNTFGPVTRMNKLMIENKFDETTANWFTGGDISHPLKDPVGVSAQLSWTTSLSSGRALGCIINYSYLRDITGYSAIAEWLSVRFTSSFLAFPVYTMRLPGKDQITEFQVAPVIMSNSGKETGTGQYPEKFFKLSPGIMSGLRLELWNKRVTYGKLGLQLVSGIPVKMGPFVAENFWGISEEIPEAGYWFGYATVFIDIGFHIKGSFLEK